MILETPQNDNKTRQEVLNEVNTSFEYSTQEDRLQYDAEK